MRSIRYTRRYRKQNCYPMKKILFSLLLILAGCDQPDQHTAGPATSFDVPPMPDFSTINDVQEKKQAFFDYLLPLVEEANSRILAEQSEEHTSELQSRENLVCRLLLEKKK